MGFQYNFKTFSFLPFPLLNPALPLPALYYCMSHPYFLHLSGLLRFMVMTLINNLMWSCLYHLSVYLPRSFLETEITWASPFIFPYTKEQTISSCLHFPCFKTPHAQSQWRWYLLLMLTSLLQRAPGNSSVPRVWGVNINRTTVKRIASSGPSSIRIISNPPCGISDKPVQDVLEHQVLSF